MKEIKLTRGFVALVDDEDFERLNQFKWLATHRKKGDNSSVYARTTLSRKLHPEGKQKYMFMHRIVMNCPSDKYIDHVDRNGLNNQKKNLRLCTNAQNQANTVSRENTSSSYKGVFFLDARMKKNIRKDGSVCYYPQKARWRASIQHNNRRFQLGDFNSEALAAMAYNEAAIKYHGEFAVLNNVHECL